MAWQVPPRNFLASALPLRVRAWNDLRIRTYEIEFVHGLTPFLTPRDARLAATALMATLPEGAEVYCDYGGCVFRKKAYDDDVYFMQVYHPDWELLPAGASFLPPAHRIVVEGLTAKLIDLPCTEPSPAFSDKTETRTWRQSLASFWNR